MFNAIGLAVVLMGLALLLILGARALFRTVDGGVVESTRSEPATTTTAPGQEGDPAGEVAAPGEGDAPAEPAPGSQPTTTTAPPLREPGDVAIRVGNSAQRSGIAAAGGSRLSALGYNVVDLSNSPPLDDSRVYHTEGYEPEARAVARALGIAETAVGPVPANPELDASGVDVVVLLGADTTVG